MGKVFTLFLFAVMSLSLNAQSLNSALHEELLKMRDVDQKAREECSMGNGDAQIQCYVKLSETIDKPHTKRLEEIYKQFGFPNAESVGKDGVEAFMLILQHAPDENLRRRLAKPVKRAFKRKEITPNEFSNYIDRLLVYQNKPQIYGSNFEIKDNKLVMSKTKDLKNLNKRRHKIGLPSIEEYAEMLNEFYKLEVVLGL